MAVKSKCQICGKEFESVNEAQAEFNLAVHTLKCKKKQRESNEKSK